MLYRCFPPLRSWMRVAVLASDLHQISGPKKKGSNIVTCPASYFTNLLGFGIIFLLAFSVWPFSAFKESCCLDRASKKNDATARGLRKFVNSSALLYFYCFLIFIFLKSTQTTYLAEVFISIIRSPQLPVKRKKFLFRPELVQQSSNS